LKNEITQFFKTRITTVLKDKNIAHDEVDAILSVDFSNLYDAYLKISVLHNYRQKENFNNLVLALKRMVNILKDVSSFKEVDEKRLIEKAEKDLFAFYQEKNEKIKNLIQSQDYEQIFVELSSFKSVVDRFFDDVLVMDKDESVKQNRLSLLHSIVVLFKSILDFEKIVVK
jgi:glycyl-tRNA synthetase beta chain